MAKPVINRLPVANWGEIAIRVLLSARQLGITTIAIYTEDDPNHATLADEAILLESPKHFIDVAKIVSICLDQKADSLHPAYGFLSENPELVEHLEQVGITLIGTTERSRAYGNVIELAPSTIKDHRVVREVINSAIPLARSIRYQLPGTFEFLAHESSGEYYFLEVNPRLQVEHTVIEEVAGIDIDAIQLRVTAEDANEGLALSMGRNSNHKLPEGQDIRVDTHLRRTNSSTVGPAYDSLLAKVIVRASNLGTVRQKAIRALHDFQITAVQSNIPALLAVLQSEDFIHGA
ncbi:uncharacterized protein Z519_01853 [Cladophialophora bantiana CBS 173.52]|uniref:Pyruvate carboxylase n=1 Tax=Cladophialophora bantiana (strain ATCC 10958 / CBS 173.52 / CDC B-1940 / NIH 8579) TaxID=1442370 RepID=A0A0D2IN96_CLAB1|nr:uncharacterized protein Z519_01853 [Cladophialophora bantiana CBS 173.52]KIW98269.1 hypothetical protein Z519_01853 [Cladophialophora bantiana CBS 173.52]